MPPTPHKLTYWNTYIVPIHTDTACKLTGHVGTCPAINVLRHFLQNMYRCVYRHNTAHDLFHTVSCLISTNNLIVTEGIALFFYDSEVL